MRPGFYGGATLQGQAINLQVSPDSSTVTTLNVTIDVHCPDLQRTVRVGLHWTNLPIQPDSSFRGQDSEVDSGLTFAYSISGRFAPEGPASGTLQMDVNGTTSGVLVNCSTGAVSWNANPQ